MKKQEIKNAIERLETDGVYIPGYIDLEYISRNTGMQTVDDLINEIEQSIQETEIIYYSAAMSFLAEEDPSLTVSLGLASDMGFTLGDLNSEALATLLLQDMLRSELYAIL